MSKERHAKNTPYLSGVIYTLDGTPISKVILWIHKPRKKTVETNHAESSEPNGC